VPFEAKILADSVNHLLERLTTCELTYPRAIHSEFMTHRSFSRNAASSRAIPIDKMLQRVLDEPFIPLHWGANQSGMQAEGELTGETRVRCYTEWLKARDSAVAHASNLRDLGLHKQLVNRIIEPFCWITVIATGSSTAYENFFHLRCHTAAEPHIQKIAFLLRDVYDASSPKTLLVGGDHLPMIGFKGDELLEQTDLKKLSVARCARVSYLTHSGVRDVFQDITMYHRLREAGHWSPFEHVATAVVSDGTTTRSGNFSRLGWYQHRKSFRAEVCELSSRA